MYKSQKANIYKPGSCGNMEIANYLNQLNNNNTSNRTKVQITHFDELNKNNAVDGYHI